MELILSDEQQLLHDSAAKFFARLGGPRRAREHRNSEAGFDREALRKMADIGWLRMLVPEEHGGLQLGPSELALVLQQAGRVLAPEPIGDTALAALMISQSDDAAIREPLLARVASGEAVIVAALQDLAGRGEPGDTGTTAVRAAAEWRLNGNKGFVLCAGGCDGFLVSARETEGLVICHVPRTAPGLELRPVATVDGRSYGELSFHNVASSGVIARHEAASAILARHHNLALVAAAAEMLGVMEGIGELTVEYLKTRKQFGRPIGSFQALQHRAVDDYVLTESTRSLLYQVCEGGEPLSAAMTSALKAVASHAALAVTKSAVQLHGAIGFTDEYDAGLYLKRAMWLSASLGNASVHQRRYARLLSPAEA